MLAITALCVGIMNRSVLLVLVAVFLVLVVSVRGEYILNDGSLEEFVGFPFIWAMDTVNSLSVEISLLALVGNAGLYLVLLHILLSGMAVRILVTGRGYKIAIGVLVLANASIICIYFIFNEIFLVGWLGTVFGENAKILSVAFIPFVG